MWNCLWGNALKRSPGIIRKSRVSYPGPGFLSSAAWPSLPKKHYNGLNQTKPMKQTTVSYLTYTTDWVWMCAVDMEGTHTWRECVLIRTFVLLLFVLVAGHIVNKYNKWLSLYSKIHSVKINNVHSVSQTIKAVNTLKKKSNFVRVC